MAYKRGMMAVAAATSVALRQYAPQHLVGSTTWTFVLLFLLQLTAWYTWKIILQPFYFSPLRHLPTPPGGNLIAGHFPRIFRDDSGAPQKEWFATVPNDGLILYRVLFNAPRVMPTTPKAIGEVLVSKSYELPKPQQIREGIGQLLGVGVLLAEGDEHKRQRKLLMPAFNFRHVKDLYPVFWSKTCELIGAIQKAVAEPKEGEEKPSDVIEIGQWASRATLDIIGVAGMGKDFNAISDPTNELYRTYDTIFGQRPNMLLQILFILFPRWLLRRLPMKRNADFTSAIEVIKRTALDLVISKRQEMEKLGGKKSGTDIISVAIQSGGFSDADLQNQLMTFLAAGHETTASSMTWACYTLARHPEIQARLRAEVRQYLPSPSSTDSTITSAQLDSLPYLSAVCNEVLRLYPPVALTMRTTVHDTILSGKLIPANTTVIIPIWATNTSEEMWGTDAHEFNPDRWLAAGQANGGGAESNYAMTTFLHGPRSCIGQAFAKAEFAALMAGFVGRYEFEDVNAGKPLKIRGGITMRPDGGLYLKVKEVPGW